MAESFRRLIEMSAAVALLSTSSLGCSDQGSSFEDKGGGADGGACVPEPDAPVETCTPAAGNEVCHEFYANDNGRHRINYVNEFEPSKGWQVTLPCLLANCPRQVGIVDSPNAACGKALLVSVPDGYQEHDLKTGELLAHVQTQPPVTGAVRLKNGNTAVVNSSQLIVVTPDGSQVSSCKLPGSGELRVLVHDDDDLYWFGRMLDLYAINDSCQEQWHATLLGGEKAYRVFPDPTGKYVYATSGATAKVHKYDRKANPPTIVGDVGGKENFPDLNLDFFSGFFLEENDDIVAANWLGHLANPAQDTVHLVEFTPANEVVWKWGNQDLARQITNVWIVR